LIRYDTIYRRSYLKNKQKKEDHVRNNSKHSKCGCRGKADHEPVWEQVGEEHYKARSELLGLKRHWWSVTCCGKFMLLYKKVIVERCKICGEEREVVINNLVAKCSCCGQIVPFTVLNCPSWGGPD